MVLFCGSGGGLRRLLGDGDLRLGQEWCRADCSYSCIGFFSVSLRFHLVFWPLYLYHHFLRFTSFSVYFPPVSVWVASWCIPSPVVILPAPPHSPGWVSSDFSHDLIPNLLFPLLCMVSWLTSSFLFSSHLFFKRIASSCHEHSIFLLLILFWNIVS